MPAGNCAALSVARLRTRHLSLSGEDESLGLRAAWRLNHAAYGPALNALMEDALRSAKPQSAAEFQAAWLAACEE